MEYISHADSPLGPITMASNGTYLIGLWFDGQKYFGDGLSETVEKELPVFEETRRWLSIYFSGKNPGFIPPLSHGSTEFRKEVDDILLSIPFGQTMTYGQVSEEIARRRGVKRISAQAVGGAVGHNRISLIIPCHRVIGSDGSLTGYAGGIKRKQYLLRLERGEHVSSEDYK